MLIIILTAVTWEARPWVETTLPFFKFIVALILSLTFCGFIHCADAIADSP